MPSTKKLAIRVSDDERPCCRATRYSKPECRRKRGVNAAGRVPPNRTVGDDSPFAGFESPLPHPRACRGNGSGSDSGSPPRCGGSSVDIAGKHFDPTLDFKRDKYRSETIGGHFGVIDELIESDGIMAHGIENTLLQRPETPGRAVRFDRRRARFEPQHGQRNEMRDLVENVRNRFHQLRSIANERMTSSRQGTVHGPRNRKDIPSLVRCESGGNQ